MLAGGVFLGLAWPQLAHWSAPALVPSVFLLLTVSLLRLDWSRLAAERRRPGSALLLIWLLVLSPVVTWLAVGFLGLPAALSTALVLMAGSSPIIAAIAFAQLLALDGALAVVTVVGATLAVPLVVPPMALLLLGLEIQLGFVAFMGRLAVLIGGPFLVAWGLRRLIGPARIAAAGTHLDGITVVVLIVFAVAIMDGVTAATLARPGFVFAYLAAAFLANLALQALGAGAFLWMGRARALTVGLMSGNRNMAILLAALAGTADFDVALFFAVGQIPIYLLPIVLAPVYRRLAPAGAATGAPRPGGF